MQVSHLPPLVTVAAGMKRVADGFPEGQGRKRKLVNTPNQEDGLGPPPSEYAASVAMRPELPTEEIRDMYGLPENYKIKYCRLCARSSLTKSEYPQELCETSAWGELIAWGNGTKACPTGVFCRQSVLIFFQMVNVGNGSGLYLYQGFAIAACLL